MELGILLEDAPCGYVLTDKDGMILRANALFRSLSGLPEGEIEGSYFQRLLSKAGTIFYETQVVPTLLLRGSLNEVALDFVVPSRQRVPLLLNAKVRRNGEGDILGFAWILFAASERRLYEHDLLRSTRLAEQMAEVVLHSSDAIVSMSPEGRIQSWNNGAEQMLGYTLSEVTGKLLSEVAFSSERRSEIAIAFASLRGGFDHTSEAVGVRRDGTRVELSVKLTPHMEAPGTLVAVSAIMRDITKRKQTERALIQNEKLASVGRLASSISHEINNPLEAVTNLLYLLDLQLTEPNAKTLLRTAQDELARVSHIATHTLRFHRQSSNKTFLEMDTLFESVLALYRARLRNADIVVRLGPCTALPLLCFEGELRQVLANLVGNAFDAMRTGGELRLRHREGTLWKTGEPCVRITVADNGTGMNAETLAHIFEAFYTTKAIGGTGLGLWITDELVVKNHGLIRVRSSNRPGRSGTIFSLTFSRALDPTRSQQAEDNPRT